MFRPEDCAKLTTPAAPNRKGNIFFMARPPLLCEEGNLLSHAGFVDFKISSCLNFGFVKYVDALKRRECSSTPLVLGVFSLQFGFDSRVMLTPKIREILGYLDRPHAGRQNVDTERHSAHSDARRFRHIEQFLNSQ